MTDVLIMNVTLLESKEALTEDVWAMFVSGASHKPKMFISSCQDLRVKGL